MNFKIKSYGIDTTNLKYRPIEEFNEEFVHISLRSGNSYLLENRLKEDTKIICSTNFLCGVGECIRELLEEIGRPVLEALLIEPECDIEKYGSEIKYLLDNELVRNIGISHPSNLMRFKDTAEKIKQYIIPKYLLLSISPVYFQKDIIDLAEEKEMIILGDNPFGGFLDSGRTIDSFSVSYLLGFSGRYSDVVLLSSRDIITSRIEEEYLEELIGKESPEMYELEVSEDHRVKPFRKVIYTSFNYSGYTIPFNDPLSIWNYSELNLDFSEPSYIDSREEKKLPKTILEIYDYVISYIKFPEDGDSGNYINLARLEICRQLRNSGYKVSVAQLGETAYFLKLTKELLEKRFLRKPKVQEITEYLLLTISGEKLILRLTENK